MIRIGLGGDLMIGRLVDEFLNDAPSDYVWGDLLPTLHQMDLNIVNLETTLTRSSQIVPKVFNFKAAPEKVAVLTEAPIHAVNLANNHILDFSEEGLLETIQVLDNAGIQHVGAGRTSHDARAACILERKGIKIGLLGCTDNEPTWQAQKQRPGTFYVEVGDLDALREPIQSLRSQVDFLILSIHWGPNMRKSPTPSFRHFAHELIDLGVDIIHGHSAHLFQGVEVYKTKLTLYDTGDFVDDYAVDPILRNDHTFFFIVTLTQDKLVSLEMVPLLISNFQVNINPSPLPEMMRLCHALHTHPIQKNKRLFLDVS